MKENPTLVAETKVSSQPQMEQFIALADRLEDALEAQRLELLEIKRLFGSLKVKFNDLPERFVHVCEAIEGSRDAVNEKFNVFASESAITSAAERLFVLRDSMNEGRDAFVNAVSKFNEVRMDVINIKTMIDSRLCGHGLTPDSDGIEVPDHYTDNGFNENINAIERTRDPKRKMEIVKVALADIPEAYLGIKSKHEKLKERLRLSLKSSPEFKTADALRLRMVSNKKTVEERTRKYVDVLGRAIRSDLNKTIGILEAIGNSITHAGLKKIAKEALIDIYPYTSKINELCTSLKGL